MLPEDGKVRLQIYILKSTNHAKVKLRVGGWGYEH